MKATGSSAQTEEAAKLNITPMIDCVFLLVTFFMVTMKFPKTEALLPAYLPREEAASAGRTDKKRENKVAITLQMSRGVLEVYFNGALMGTRTRGTDNLDNALFALSREAPDSRVILDARRDVPFKYIIQVMDLCALRHFTDISFATPAPEGGDG